MSHPLVPLLALKGRAALRHYALGFQRPRRLLALLGALVFVALGLATSVFVRSPTRALTWILLCWAVAVALLDFGLIGSMLRWHVPPQLVFGVVALNPVGAARLALLAAAEPELATLGPVGFYLAHRLGASALLVLGVGWPLLFGVVAWGLARHRFRRGDVV